MRPREPPTGIRQHLDVIDAEGQLVIVIAEMFGVKINRVVANAAGGPINHLYLHITKPQSTDSHG
jgi:hypothetical protein